MQRDPYDVLGVDRSASQDDIKKAYRKLARELHPDANGGDSEAEARFKDVAAAYEVIGDTERRARYDQYGAAGFTGSAGDGFGGGLGDLFEAFFGGGFRGGPPSATRGVDLEVVAEVDLRDAVFGCEHDVTVRTAIACDTCQATGAAPGTTATTCSECRGSGQVRVVRQSILGQMVTAGLCRVCKGEGITIASPCEDCKGEGRTITQKTYTIDVPGGVDDGTTLRLSGRGAAGVRGNGVGDLYVEVHVRPDPRFARQGTNLVHELHVAFTQAALGAEIPLETFDGESTVTVPHGTQTGDVFRLRGQGVPSLRTKGRGDLLVQVVVDVPESLTDEQEDLLRQLAALRGEDVAPADEGLLSKIKSAFR